MIDRNKIKVGDELDFRFKVREKGIDGTIWMDSPFLARHSYIGWQTDRERILTSDDRPQSNLIAHHPAPESPLKVGDCVGLNYGARSYRGKIHAISPSGLCAWIEVTSSDIFTEPLVIPVEEIRRM